MAVHTYNGVDYVVERYQSGDSDLTEVAQLVAGVAGQRIVVLAATWSAGSAASLSSLRSGTDDILRLGAPIAHCVFAAPLNPHGWCRTGAGEALTFNPDVVGTAAWRLTLDFITVPDGE